MRTAKELLNEYLGGNLNISTLTPIAFYDIINSARVETIKECAEVAKTGQGEQWRKDAILKLIEKIN